MSKKRYKKAILKCSKAGGRKFVFEMTPTEQAIALRKFNECMQKNYFKLIGKNN